MAIDLTPDARAWPDLPAERREPPDDAARRLLRGRGGGRRADRAVRRRSAAGDAGLPGEPDGLGLLPAAPRRAAPRDVLRPHRRRGARAAGSHAGRATRRGPRIRPGRGARALRGAAARGWPPSSRPAHGTRRGHQPLPHAARGGRLRRRADALLDDLADGALPGVREGIERVERDERWHVGFGLRCLIETAALSGPPRRPGGARRGGRRGLGRRRPRRHARAAARASARTGCTSPGSSRRPRRRSAHAARRARTRAASRGPERLPSPHAAERTPAMSAPGGADHRQVLGAQGAGQRHLQTRGMGVGHQRRQRVGREPVQEPAAVLDRRVEQADPDARRGATRGSSSGASGACATRRASA